MKSIISILMVLVIAATARAAAPKATYTFQSQRKPGQTDRVTVLLEVGGETKFTDDGKPQREKMSVLCNLDYHEKTLDVPDNRDGTWRSVRDYTKAAGVVKVGGDEFKPTLRTDRHLICAEAVGQTTRLSSPLGKLLRTELEVIDVQANSLLLDRLLPEKPVAIGDTWKHSGELLAAMLGLDEVAKTDVQSRLKEATDTLARFEIEGKVEGAIHGVATKIEIKGKYRFDLRRNRVDWLGLLVKEDRQGSFVADGVDAVSRLQMTLNAAMEPESLAEAALAKLPLKSTPEVEMLTYESPGGWQFNHDRRWYVYRDQHDVAVLRLLDRGTLTAQCNVSSLPQRAPDKLVSLEEFQADVRKALGKSFGEFVEAGQSVDDAKHRVLRVAVEGKASDIPIRWIYYHVADEQGRQTAFTFTVEKSLLERFAATDKPLVESLRFVEPKEKETEKKNYEDSEGTKKNGKEE